MVLYADRETDAIRDLLRITDAHRRRQTAYNKAHHVVPKSVKRSVNEATHLFRSAKAAAPGADAEGLTGAELVAELKREMLEAAERLEFERAAYLRDQIKRLEAGAAKPGGGGKASGKMPGKAAVKAYGKAAKPLRKPRRA